VALVLTSGRVAALHQLQSYAFGHRGHKRAQRGEQTLAATLTQSRDAGRYR